MKGTGPGRPSPDQPVVHLSWGTLRLLETTCDADGNVAGFRAVTVPDGQPVRMRFVKDADQSSKPSESGRVETRPWMRRRS